MAVITTHHQELCAERILRRGKVQSRPQGGDTKDWLRTGPRRESALSDQPTDTSTDLTTSDSAAIQPDVECKGIRPIKDFPRDLTGLSPEQIEHHYKALRNSHISLNRSRTNAVPSSLRSVLTSFF